MWMPRSAPFASASFIVCFTRSGPIDSAITSPPCFSFRRRASSRAKRSGSFISKPMSDSLIQLPEIASGASLAGTCLMHTMIFMGICLLLDDATTTQMSFRGRFEPEESAFSHHFAKSGFLASLRNDKSGLFPRPALENQRGVGSAKSKRIRKRVVHCMFSGMIRDVIQITFRIGIKLVDRRRQNPVAQGQHADTGFEPARSAQQVSRHRFRRAYRKLLVHRAVAEEPLHGASFNRIADWRRSSVRVDVADIVRGKFCVL